MIGLAYMYIVFLNNKALNHMFGPMM